MFCLTSMASLPATFTSPKTSASKAVAHISIVRQHFDGTLNYLYPMAFATENSDNDTYTVKQMLQQDDVGDFIVAMQKEIHDHESRNHWTILPRSALPQGTKTIMSIWSFKRKHFPDGRIMKHKSRLCAHGGMQKWGVDYWETYSPVVNWVSVRLLFALCMIHDLESRSIDFVLAFPQADLKEDIYMELTFGFDCDGDRRYVMKLNKSIYGLCQSSSNWFQHLTKGLKARDFFPSQIDPCVYYKDNCIVLVYVDGCIVYFKDKSVIDGLIWSL